MIDLPPPTPGFELTLASRGYSKGLAQTDGAQLVARPEIAFGAVYVGGYAKNVTSTTLDGEGGPTIGFRTSTGGFDLAGSATLKLAIAPAAGTDQEAIELNGSLARAFGPATARLGVTWSPDDVGGTGRSIYWEGGLGYRFGRSTTATVNLGRRERDGGDDYSSFNLGLSRTLVRGVSVELRWYDTDRSARGDPFEERLVAALRFRL